MSKKRVCCNTFRGQGPHETGCVHYVNIKIDRAIRPSPTKHDPGDESLPKLAPFVATKRESQRPIERCGVGTLDESLWGKPSEPSTLRHITVVGPYPSVAFFASIRDNLQPEEVLVVVDDSCSVDVTREIRGLFPSERCELRFACRGNGLVHAKLYLLEWRVLKDNTLRFHLAWGSANPSMSGFHTNAEAMSSCPLSQASHREVLDYFATLRMDKKGSVERLNTMLSGQVQLYLPRFSFAPEAKSTSFESWIQSGRLCHKYVPDQTFGKLVLKLKDALPQSEYQRVLTASGWAADNSRDTFRYSYAGEDAEISKPEPHWRSQYFVETWLGYWTSAACYRELRTEFASENKPRRESILRTVKFADADDHKRWIREYLDRVDNASKLIRSLGKSANKYFHLSSNGEIDVGRYQDAARGTFRNHSERANSAAFEARFVSGFEFPEMPRFRDSDQGNGASFRDFVIDLCESLCNGIIQKAPQNKLSKLVKTLFTGKELDNIASSDLKLLIESRWPKISDLIRGFHKI